MEPGGRIFGPEETVSPLMLNPGDKHSHVMHTPQIVIPPRDLTGDAMHSVVQRVGHLDCESAVWLKLM